MDTYKTCHCMTTRFGGNRCATPGLTRSIKHPTELPQEPCRVLPQWCSRGPTQLATEKILSNLQTQRDSPRAFTRLFAMGVTQGSSGCARRWSLQTHDVQRMWRSVEHTNSETPTKERSHCQRSVERTLAISRPSRSLGKLRRS